MKSSRIDILLLRLIPLFFTVAVAIKLGTQTATPTVTDPDLAARTVVMVADNDTKHSE